MKHAFLVVLFYCGICVCILKIDSCVAQLGLELTIYARMTLNFWSFLPCCLFLLNVEITSRHCCICSTLCCRSSQKWSCPLAKQSTSLVPWFGLSISHQRSEQSHWQFPLGCPLPSETLILAFCAPPHYLLPTQVWDGWGLEASLLFFKWGQPHHTKSQSPASHGACLPWASCSPAEHKWAKQGSSLPPLPSLSFCL